MNEIACYPSWDMPGYLNADAGTTYYLRVAGEDEATGEYELRVDYISAVEPMTHDDCSSAYALSIGQQYVGTTEGASGTDITSCACDDACDVWHTVSSVILPARKKAL